MERSENAKSAAMTPGNLTIRLGEPLKAQWLAWCKERGFRPTASLKQVVLDTLAAQDAAADPALLPEFTEGQGNSDEKRVRMEIRFTQSELAAVQARAAAEGIAPRLWIVHAIRSQLTGQYQMPDEAIQTAAELYQELRTIGQNLNQVARVLNTNTAIPAHELEGVMVTHKKHLKALEAGFERLSNVLASYATRLPLKRVR